MSVFQELGLTQIQQCLDEAITQKIPLAILCRIESTCYNLHSVMLRRCGEHLYLAEVVAREGRAPELRPGTLLSVSFKLRHYKHVFQAVVEEIGIRSSGLDAAVALRLGVPRRMQRIQRRAFLRAEVPRSRSVLATFWHGGGEHPGKIGDGAVCWEGWVTNISAGGVQVRLPSQICPELEVGDLVGVRVDLGQEFPHVTVDAQFRQAVSDPRGVTLLGFQFVGLSDTAQGRQTLNVLAMAVSQFRMVQPRRSDVA